MNLVLVFLSHFICIFLDFLYSFFYFYILYRLFCYLFISLFYAGPKLIAVFTTEMVILHKYVRAINRQKPQNCKNFCVKPRTEIIALTNKDLVVSLSVI